MSGEKIKRQPLLLTIGAHFGQPAVLRGGGAAHADIGVNILNGVDGSFIEKKIFRLRTCPKKPRKSGSFQTSKNQLSISDFP